MSDGGGGESSKDIEPCLKRRKKNDEFAQAISRIAVAQVCESVGFQGFQQSALDRLSDVACKYIREIGKTSNFYANLAGRTECNVFDIVQGLEDLSLSQGFVGASDRDHCLSGSGIIKEISQYVSLSEEIAFAYSVPSFPVVKQRNTTSSFLQAGETPPTDVIPPWLPQFPDPTTYASTPLAGKEETETRPDRIEQEHKVLDPPSSKLEQRWAYTESEFPAADQGDNVGRDRGTNPFLAVPLQPGEKEVSLVSIPAKLKEEDTVQNHGLWANHVSALDAFAPTNQAVKSGGGRDGEEGGGREVVLNNRPALQMKFRVGGKKPLEVANRHDGKRREEVVSWFVNDEVGDDAKEKRTEKISREPMEIEEHTGIDSVVN